VDACVRAFTWFRRRRQVWWRLIVSNKQVTTLAEQLHSRCRKWPVCWFDFQQKERKLREKAKATATKRRSNPATEERKFVLALAD
jgi:hypothetical protein